MAGTNSVVASEAEVQHPRHTLRRAGTSRPAPVAGTNSAGLLQKVRHELQGSSCAQGQQTGGCRKAAIQAPRKGGTRARDQSCGPEQIASPTHTVCLQGAHNAL